MNVMKGLPILGGRATGPAIVTKMPINFTASFTKPKNLIGRWRSQIQDRHHELYGHDVKGGVLVYPATIGSTYTGMILLELIHHDCAPAAIIVQRADSLMVSGPILGDVWLDKGIPVVEYESDDIFEKVSSGDRLEVDGDTGEIKILSA
jgi:predicted aconitase with swiveling domain